MQRKLLWLLSFVLVLAIAGSFWLFNSLDHIVKNAIEGYGSAITGVKISLQGVKISPTEGTGTLRGLTIGNPGGFVSDAAFKADEIMLQVEAASLTQEVIHLNQLHVASPTIDYEVEPSGTNFDIIQRNVTLYRGSSAPDKASKRFIIDELRIDHIKVNYRPSLLQGKAIELIMPDLTLHHVGQAKGGVTSGELASIIVAALKKRLASTVAKAALRATAGTLRDGAEGVGSGISQLLR